RERSLALQRHADALLLLAQPARSQLVNFKLFEYLAAGRPILGLCAGTEAGRILGGAGVPTVAADDAGAVAAALGSLVEDGLGVPPAELGERYRYPATAEAISALAERVIAERGGAVSPDARGA
ncbi:MAG: hypothetical protein JJE23_15085, partial [Thermoleophilia bacterium]|nr:hypothetical protein [Thermoleophilia bacterium]